MKRWIVIAVLGAATAVGCEKTVTHEMDCRVWWESQKDVEDVAPDTGADSEQGLLPAGAACTKNDECGTTQCFCGETVTEDCFDLKATAEGLGATWNYVLTGGMCSKLFCNPAKADACGDGGFCFDVAPLFQASMTIGLCLANCEEYDDCRYQEGYVCYFTGVEGQRACLPDNLVKDIPCGDGACALGETESVCPRDCFCGNGTCDSGEDNASCSEDCQ